MRYTAIVLAAGKGKRMNTDVSKQFLELNGKPVLYYSLEAFEKSSIDQVILVTGEDDLAYCQKEIVEKYQFQKVVKIIAGGKERYDSVWKGLQAAQEMENCADGLIAGKWIEKEIEVTTDGNYAGKEIEQGIEKEIRKKIEKRTEITSEIEKGTEIKNRTEMKSRNEIGSKDEHYIFIHDGARAFLDQDTIQRCMEDVRISQACTAAVPVKDTIKQVDAALLGVETPDRSTLWTIQTPQVFKQDLIYAAYEKLNTELQKGCAPKVTDDTMVLEYYQKIQAHMVMGSYYNIKITTPEDLIFGKAILAHREECENKAWD